MKKRGISLIVLIITIIVVIILASIIILSFNKNNPIQKAQEAKFKSDVSQFKEELLMTHANNLAENKKYKSESVNVSAGDYASMRVYIPSITKDYADRLYIQNGELVYVNVNNGNYDKDESNWASSINIQIGKTPIPEEWKKYISEVTEDGVPIPKGFTQVSGTTKDSGLVIEDENHNEFVWIPSNLAEYEKDFGFKNSYDATKDNTTDSTILSGLNETNDVNIYNGFYIGRYEATVADTSSNGKPTCKKGCKVWENISYPDAVIQAESMYTGTDSSVQSGLLTGKAWDRTCHWISDYKIKVNDVEEMIDINDSRKYGNYHNSEAPANIGKYVQYQKQLSGANENWKTKNIYDLAGNTSEWTYEESGSYHILRGGNYDFSGDNYPVSYRLGGYSSSSSLNIGFRVRLYIKTN